MADAFMMPVRSDSIREIGYDPASAFLYIRFYEDNALYRYDEIPPDVWEAFSAAESKGGFHNKHLRNKFTWHLVDETPSP